MAIGFSPVVTVKSANGARGERKLRLVAAVSVSLALLVATVAVQRSTETGAVSLGEGTDEKMKGWEDGMFPPHATFPAGYHFGNDNGWFSCDPARFPVYLVSTFFWLCPAKVHVLFYKQTYEGFGAYKNRKL